METCQQCGNPVFSNADQCPHCGADDPRASGNAVGSPQASSGPPALNIKRRKHIAAPEEEPVENQIVSWADMLSEALQLIESGDSDSAIKRLNQALVDAPEEHLARCYAYRGYAYLVTEQWDDALSDLQQSLDRDPFDAETYAWRGTAHAALQQWRKAIEDCLQAIDFASEQQEAYRDLLSGYLEEAVVHLSKSISSNRKSPTLFADRGLVHFHRKAHENALADLKEAIRLGEQQPQTYLYRAQCYGELGHPEKVVHDCTIALKQLADNFDAYLLRAKALCELGKHEHAIADLNRADKLSPENAEVIRQRALSHERAGNLSEAVDDYRAATTLVTDDFASLESLAGVLKDLYRPAESAECLTPILELAPDPDLLLRRGYSYLDAGMQEEANADFQAILQDNPGSALAYCGRGKALASQNDLEGAEAATNKAIRLDRQYAPAYVVRGEVYLSQQKQEEAIADFTRAMNLDDDSLETAEVLSYRGIAYAELGRFTEAEEDFTNSLALRRDDVASLTWRANVRFQLNRPRAAVNDLTLAMELQPNKTSDFRTLGKASSQAGIEAFTAELSQDPNSASLLRDCGVLRRFLGDHQGALKDFSAAIAADSSDADTFYQRAFLNQELKNWSQCAEDCSQALSLAPQQSEAAFLRGVACLQLNQPSESLADLNEAIQCDPTDARRWAARGLLFSRAGKHQRAEADYSKAINLSPCLARFLLERGNARARSSAIDSAIDDFTYALMWEPELADAFFGRGKAYALQREFSLAIEDFDHTIQLDAGYVGAYCQRASAIARQGDLIQATIELTKALPNLSSDERFVALLESRAKFFYKLGQLSLARADYRAAAARLGKTPRAAAALGAAGLCVMHGKDQEGAVKLVDTALQIDPKCELARIARQWLAGELSSLPPALDAPKQKSPLPEPPVTSAKMATEVDPSWQSQPPWHLWIVRTADQKEFGPVSLQRLTLWCSEGKLDDQAHLLRSDWDQWRWAYEVFPQLTVATARNANRPIPVSMFANEEEEEPAPEVADVAEEPATTAWKEPADSPEEEGDGFPHIQLD